ncbi:MAG: hypothetical protein ACRDY7_01990 [Acidimicrobiia bacterium]
MSERGDGSERPAGRVVPVVKTHYTAEEFRALFEGLPPPTDDDRTILRGFDRPATEDELRAFAEELWAIYRAEQEAG